MQLDGKEKPIVKKDFRTNHWDGQWEDRSQYILYRILEHIFHSLFLFFSIHEYLTGRSWWLLRLLPNRLGRLSLSGRHRKRWTGKDIGIRVVRVNSETMRLGRQRKKWGGMSLEKIEIKKESDYRLRCRISYEWNKSGHEVKKLRIRKHVHEKTGDKNKFK